MAQVFRVDRRRDKRRPLPELTVRIDDRVSGSLDWSLGGLSISDLPRHYQVGDLVTGQLSLAGAEEQWFPFMARVVRRDRLPRGSGLHFENLSAECFDFLEAIVLRRAAMPVHA